MQNSMHCQGKTIFHVKAKIPCSYIKKAGKNPGLNSYLFMFMAIGVPGHNGEPPQCHHARHFSVFSEAVPARYV